MYLDVKLNAGYTNEMEKLERNDSKISLCINLKNTATKKHRLRAWGYALGEYLYILGWNGLTLHCKTYSISQEDDYYLKWENNQLNEVFGTSAAEKKEEKAKNRRFFSFAH